MLLSPLFSRKQAFTLSRIQIKSVVLSNNQHCTLSIFFEDEILFYVISMIIVSKNMEEDIVNDENLGYLCKVRSL